MLHGCSPEEAANVHQVHLPAIATVGRVEDHGISFWTEPRMQVTTPLTCVRFGAVEAPYRVSSAGGHVAEIEMLQPFFADWIGIVSG